MLLGVHRCCVWRTEPRRKRMGAVMPNLSSIVLTAFISWYAHKPKSCRTTSGSPLFTLTSQQDKISHPSWTISLKTLREQIYSPCPAVITTLTATQNSRRHFPQTLVFKMTQNQPTIQFTQCSKISSPLHYRNHISTRMCLLICKSVTFTLKTK